MHQDRTRSVVPRVADPSAGLRLIVFCGGEVSSHVLPRSGEVVIGRGENANVRVDHVTVSRRHATLLLGEDGVRIVDHGSFNGTTIGGKKIAPNVPVPLGLATIAELGETMVVVQVDGGAGIRASRMPVSSAPRSQRSAAMEHLYRLVESVAQSDITVLLRGETGAGKEVVAEQVHARSPRAGKPLVKLNCAALPEHLLEGELFGYEKGAFTGAAQAKPGLVEAAEGGTLFLDEIGELPLATQAKLLRVVESREVLRLGSLKPRSVDLRIVAATHRDLEDMVARGTFRQDLYYRICGVILTIPPLRERVEEIPTLANELVARACREARRPVLPISDAAMSVLLAYSWPGNVRELRNVLDRAVVFCRGIVIAPEHLGLAGERMTQPPAAPMPAYGMAPPPQPFGGQPPYPPPAAYPAPPPGSGGFPTAAPYPPPQGHSSYPPPPPQGHGSYPPPAPHGQGSYPPPPPAFAQPPGASTVAFGSNAPGPLHEEVDALERERIMDALARCGGNQTQAAEMLGISRRTLLRRLDAYAVPRPRKG